MTGSERLKIFLKEINKTQHEFASDVGLTQGTVSDIIRGKTSGLSLSAVKLCKYLYNANPAWLLTGEGEMFITLSDVKDGVISYSAIADINEITRTRWFKNLTKEQRDIITNCSAVKDKEILKKVSGIISRQSAKEEGDRELEELEDKTK